MIISSDDLVYDAIIKVLDVFNSNMKPQKLSLNILNYAPQLSKRNGKPKLDMPSLDLKQIIIEIRVDCMNIQVKNKDQQSSEKEGIKMLRWTIRLFNLKMKNRELC